MKRSGKNILQGMIGKPAQPTLAKVVDVNEATMTCVVEFDRGQLAGQKLQQVALLPYDFGENQFVVIPSVKPGENEVLVLFLEGNSRRAVVTKVFGGVEAILLTLNGMVFELRSTGQIELKGFDKISLDGGGAHPLLDTFLESYKNHTHLTPNGPSQPPMPQFLQDEANWINPKINIKQGE